MRSRITTADTLNDPLPETIAAERLRQHLEEIARERDNAYRALQEREAELARIQRIGKVGGLEVDFREGFKNRRSPEYLTQFVKSEIERWAVPIKASGVSLD